MGRDRRPPRVPAHCDHDVESWAPGETVYILRELPAGRGIHDIGSRARVLAERGAALALHLDGSDAEAVMCPRDDVTPRVDPHVAPRDFGSTNHVSHG